jgi:hypothetical protein
LTFNKTKHRKTERNRCHRLSGTTPSPIIWDVTEWVHVHVHVQALDSLSQRTAEGRGPE